MHALYVFSSLTRPLRTGVDLDPSSSWVQIAQMLLEGVSEFEECKVRCWAMGATPSQKGLKATERFIDSIDESCIGFIEHP